MRASTLFLALVLLVVTATPAVADPRAAFDKELELTTHSVDSAHARVRSALVAKSWSAWCPAHEAYVNALNRGVVDIENAVTRYLFAVLNSGGTFDQDALTAIDDAAWLAGDYAHRRVLVSSWSVLVRRGIPPQRRAAALDLLARQGVYEGTSRRREPRGVEASCDPGPNASPISGRVPGSPEAAQALSKWQYAQMRAESTAQTIQTYEAELLGAKEGSRQRQAIEKRLAEARIELADLEKSAEEWRRKYFELGGR